MENLLRPNCNGGESLAAPRGVSDASRRCKQRFVYSEVFDLKPTSGLSHAQSCLKNPAHLSHFFTERTVSAEGAIQDRLGQAKGRQRPFRGQHAQCGRGTEWHLILTNKRSQQLFVALERALRTSNVPGKFTGEHIGRNLPQSLPVQSLDLPRVMDKKAASPTRATRPRDQSQVPKIQ
jgi:hypothetical protein